jgi:hypothetical protein
VTATDSRWTERSREISAVAVSPGATVTDWMPLPLFGLAASST